MTCPECEELKFRFKRLLDAMEIEIEQKVMDAYKQGLERGMKHSGGDTFQADVENKHDVTGT
jgi:hypothetical protein